MIAAAQSQLEMWNLIVGFLLPPAVAVVQQRHWPAGVQAVVTFLVACLAAAGTAYFDGRLTAAGWATGALTVLVTAVATYHGLWKPTGVAPAIQDATSPKPPPSRAELKQAVKPKPTDTAPAKKKGGSAS